MHNWTIQFILQASRGEFCTAAKAENPSKTDNQRHQCSQDDTPWQQETDGDLVAMPSASHLTA